ncbi:MAG: CoA transferase, partial [Dehalococcoidia bacterium]
MSDLPHPASEPWRAIEGDPAELAHLAVTGDGPSLSSVHQVTELAAGSIGAATLAASLFWRDRGGPPPAASVDRTESAVAFRSERYTRHESRQPANPWAPLSGDYLAAPSATNPGGQWVRIHANFDHHRDAALRVLGLLDPSGDGASIERAAVDAAVAMRDGERLVEAIKAAGGAASSWRTAEEWRAHPQGAALAGQPLVRLTALDTSPPRPFGAADRPLEGVRVLDLSRVLAGPIAGRFLGAHGAEVLRVSGPHLPTFEDADRDTGFGKRSCFVDLRTEEGRATLRGLVADADVFLQAYRPGALATLGFAPSDLAVIRPGLVVVHLSAYGSAGPWREHRGFDSLVQMASGIVAAETETEAAGHPPRPVSLPAQALDHATGYLAALGVIAGLRRRHARGGSTLVELSLARTGRWLQE